MMHKRLGYVACGLFLTACSTPGTATAPPVAAAASSDSVSAKATPHVYWTLFAGSGYPQIQFAKVPLTAKSQVSNVFSSQKNTLNYSSGSHVDSLGRLWVIVFGKNSGKPGTALVFKLPLTASSTPLYTFVLSGTDDPDHLTFDASGNLWVNSQNNNSALEYTGPFKKSGTLSPATTVTDGLDGPSGIALDASGNLYISNFASSGSNSIAVFTAPISNREPYYLDGLYSPGGLVFDKQGNLYASSNGSSHADAIVRYNSGHLTSGSKPSIVDSTGLQHTYGSDFSLSPTGDLYFANCGSTGSIIVYPTSTKSFSSSLAPSVNYTNADLKEAGCGWGIAIK